MLKDSGTQKAQMFAQLLDERYANAQTSWSGPPEGPSYVFELLGPNKRIVVAERVFDIWGASKTGLEKMLAHHGIDEKIAQAPGGSELSIEPGNGEKPEITIRPLQQAELRTGTPPAARP